MRVLVRDPSLKSGGGKSVELLFAMAVESHLRAPLARESVSTRRA